MVIENKNDCSIRRTSQSCIKNKELCVGLKAPTRFEEKLVRFNQLVKPFSVLTSQLQEENLSVPQFNKYWSAAMLKPTINDNWTGLVENRRSKNRQSENILLLLG